MQAGDRADMLSVPRSSLLPAFHVAHSSFVSNAGAWASMLAVASTSFSAAFHVASTRRVLHPGEHIRSSLCEDGLSVQTVLTIARTFEGCLTWRRLTAELMHIPRSPLVATDVLPANPRRTMPLFAVDPGRRTRARAAGHRKSRPRASFALA